MAESTSTNNAPVGPASVIVEIPQGSGPAQIPLDVSDPDGDRLWYQMEPRPWPLFGRLEWDPDAGALCYEPFPDFIGVESFTLIVSDGRGGSVEQRVTVAVGQPAPTGENHIPVAPTAITVEMLEDTEYQPIFSGAFDADGDRLYYPIDPDHRPLHGSVGFHERAQAYLYSPDANSAARTASP